MSERPRHRSPMTIKLDDPHVVVVDPEEDKRPARGSIQITPDPDPAMLPVAVEPASLRPRRGLRWGTVFWVALAGLALLGAGLGAVDFVESLFARSESLGLVGLTFAIAAALALLMVTVREILGLTRLAAIETMHQRAAAVLRSDDRAESRTVARELLKLAHQNPQLAHARATVENHISDIIDGGDMIRLAERELMGPLDQEARRLVSSAAQRVSLITAISPRALVDMLFVFLVSLRLIRQLARLYGGRPGALGTIRLTRHVIAHLAITGGMAASDSLIQQVLGHGIAAKLSQRLGEGLLNGLLTARLGLAAIEVTRPLPFTALPRPALADLVRNLGKDLRRKGDHHEE